VAHRSWLGDRSPSSGIAPTNARASYRNTLHASAQTLQSVTLYGRASTVTVQLGRRIRALRQALSLTQEQLAEKASISVSFLSMIERAERVPHLKTLSALSKALGIPLSRLFLDLNGRRAKDEQTQALPLIAYLGTLSLSSGDVETLLLVAKAMFDGKS